MILDDDLIQKFMIFNEVREKMNHELCKFANGLQYFFSHKSVNYIEEFRYFELDRPTPGALVLADVESTFGSYSSVRRLPLCEIGNIEHILEESGPYFAFNDARNELIKHINEMYLNKFVYDHEQQLNFKIDKIEYDTIWPFMYGLYGTVVMRLDLDKCELI